MPEEYPDSANNEGQPGGKTYVVIKAQGKRNIRTSVLKQLSNTRRCTLIIQMSEYAKEEKVKDQYNLPPQIQMLLNPM